MIDLPDLGYTSSQVTFVDPAGVIEGSLGGPSQIIDRPGLRYAVQYTLPHLPAALARQIQILLEQGLRDDVSYPWPMDNATLSGGSPTIATNSPAGAVIPITGLPPSFIFRAGQPFSIISEGTGFVHKATTEQVADASGNIILNVWPITRKTFLAGDKIELGEPRISGVLSWNGSPQEAYGGRPFSFSITERY